MVNQEEVPAGRSKVRHSKREQKINHNTIDFSLTDMYRLPLVELFGWGWSRSMKTGSMVAVRKAAEAAVADMSDGALKTAAFQTILTQLLQKELAIDGSKGSIGSGKSSLAKRGSAPRVTGTTGRLLNLVAEGVFRQQKSLAEIRQILSEKGWLYRPEDLGTPVTRLVRRRHLRRIQVVERGKKIWKYSDY